MTMRSSQKRRILVQVAQASAHPIQHAIARIDGYGRIWPLADPNSPIVNWEAQKFISDLAESAVSKSDADLLAQYLAHAGIQHMFSGWGYLGQALRAFLNGARAQATHFAYYAELRAAFSLFASFGISVSNENHFVLDRDGRVHWFGGPTHDVAWQVLTALSERTDMGVELLSGYSAFGLLASDWAVAAGVPTLNWPDISHMWLSNWSVDLKFVGQDRKIRNRASYNCDMTADAFAPVTKVELELGFVDKRQPLFDGCD